jgi:hypothetical protein
MNLREAARRLGGEVIGSQISCPGPGHGPKDRSLSVRFERGTFVVHSFAGDDWRTCRDYVVTMLGIQEVERPAPTPRPRVVEPSFTDATKVDRALALWAAGTPPRGTLVEAYLAGRGIELDAYLASGAVLRFLERCPFGRQTRPAMLGLFRDVKTDEPCGISRLALTAHGAKDRDINRMFAGQVGGAAIKIDPNELVEYGLSIGEGVETCLSVRQDGHKPVWALGSATAIARFPVLAGVEALTIWADNDENGVGQRAAELCADRWSLEGAEVRVITPKRRGADFNDIARGAR